MTNASRRSERLIADNAQEALRLRLRRMTSATICQRMLEGKHPGMSADLRAAKAEGVASALRSALGYWETSAVALNAKILSQYYFALQLSIAEQVASGDADASLVSIQKHTEQGHGLGTLRSPEGDFPENYFVAALKSGHFSSYCKAIGIDLGNVAFDARPRSWTKLKEDEKPRLVSISDLLRRIPELRPLIFECLQLPPLSFHTVHATKNFEIEAEARATRVSGAAQNSGSLSDESTKTTYVTFATGFGGGEGVTAEYISAIGFPIANISTDTDFDGREIILGQYTHPASEFWWQSLPLYPSITGTSLIAPLWGSITDPFVIHFITLYALSIIVRYLPSLWYEIEHGQLDHIKALLEQYVAVVDVVLPKMGVERITGVRLNVIYPGSGQSPI